MDNTSYDILDLMRENSASLVVQTNATKASFTDAYSSPVPNAELSGDVPTAPMPEMFATAPTDEVDDVLDEAVMSSDESPTPTPLVAQPPTAAVLETPSTAGKRGRRPRSMSGDSESTTHTDVGPHVPNERPRRAATKRKAEDSGAEDDDSDGEDLGVGFGDHPRDIERVRQQLNAKMEDLNAISRLHKGCSPADRKKVLWHTSPFILSLQLYQMFALNFILFIFCWLLTP